MNICTSEMNIEALIPNKPMPERYRLILNLDTLLYHWELESLRGTASGIPHRYLCLEFDGYISDQKAKQVTSNQTKP